MGNPIDMNYLVEYSENKIRKFEDLPDDIIEEIVLRLPTQEVAQIVSYMGLKKLSYLGLKHLQVQSSKPSSIGFMINIETDTLSKYIIYSSKRDEIRQLKQTKPRNVDRLLVGCSNGLICDVNFNFTMNEIVLKIMNPLLVTTIFIPQPSLPLDLEYLDVFGFGCMGLTGDYKIVRLVQTLNVRAIEVYSSKKGIWTQINLPWPVYCNERVKLMYDPLAPLKISTGISSILLGTKLYWLVKEGDVFRGVIAFDLVGEIFEVVKTFSSQPVEEEFRITLGILDGQVAAAKENGRGGFEVCLVNQDSEKWERCRGNYPLEPAAYDLGLHSQMYGPYPHMETLLLSSKSMPTVVAAIACLQ